MRQPQFPLPRGFAQGAMVVFNPKKSVIIDMIMIQLLGITITLLGVLLFSGDKINGDHMAWMVASLFLSFVLASAIYSRITQV